MALGPHPTQCKYQIQQIAWPSCARTYYKGDRESLEKGWGRMKKEGGNWSRRKLKKKRLVERKGGDGEGQGQRYG